MVIAYHEIVPDQCPYIYGTTRTVFEEHLEVIKRRQGAAEDTPVITFDDGHISHFEHALPLLEKHGLKAAFFVTAGWVEREPKYMKKAQLRELLSRGHLVYAHGWSHRMLTHCTPAELWEELHHARQILEDILGASVDSLSIPHGRWNRRVVETCAEAGYRRVYTSDSHSEPVCRSGVRLVGRLMITRRLSVENLVAFLEGRRKSGLPKAKNAAKRLLRAAIGDERYRKIWLSVGAKQESLPDPLPAKRPLRVLQLISSGGFYGAENMVLNLAKALPSSNCTAVVCAFRNSRNPHTEIVEQAQRKQLTTEVVLCSGRLDLKAIRQIRKLIYRHGIDAVHAHGFKAQFYGAMAARGLRVGLVTTYHSKRPDRGFRLRCYDAVNRLLLFRFNKVVAVSEQIEQSLQQHGVPREKLITIGNGVEIEAFLPRQTCAPRGLQRACGPVIGLVGRLIPEKGHCYLLQSAATVLGRFPEACFLFVGTGPELGNLEALTCSLGLKDRVAFRGFEADMPAIYSEIDVVVLPSLTEGLPMTLIEAMTAKRPVIATDVGDIPKLVRNGETGLLVKPRDVGDLSGAILRLLSEPEYAAGLAANGQRLAVEKFSSQEMARCYTTAYSQALTCKP